MTKRPLGLLLAVPAFLSAQVIAIRAGHLIDPETGTSAANQVLLVEAGKFTAIGSNVAIPQGAEVIDLSQSYV
jgi:imidazolonepropionase-like amidohydrolase